MTDAGKHPPGADPIGRGRRPAAAGDAPGSTGHRWVVGFTLRLLAGWALAIAVLALAPGIERWAVAATVESVGVALRLATLQPEISGATIQVGQAAIMIIPECTPVMPVLLLAIAIAAYPARPRWKLAGIAAGLVALWLFNVVRMLALLATLTWWPRTFKFMHVYLWQTVTLLVVAGLFVAWLQQVERRESRG